MKRKEIIRKILFVLIWYIFLYNIIFLILAPTIYEDTLYTLGILIIWTVGAIDTAIRPFSSKEREVGLDRYTGLLFVSFILAPVVVALSFHENQLIFSKLFPTGITLPVTLVGYLLFIIGGAIMISGRYQIGKFGSGILVIEEDHRLMKTGIYKHIRHPIYAGGVISSFACILIFRSLIFAPISFLYHFFLIYIRLKQEETLLLEKFGDEYEEYMKTSKRLFPFIY